MFDSINADLIRSCTLRTTGAAGQSGLNAHKWRRLCTRYKGPSNDLCNALAIVTKRICSTFIDSRATAPLLACRLIAIDKNPGVSPLASETPQEGSWQSPLPSSLKETSKRLVAANNYVEGKCLVLRLQYMPPEQHSRRKTPKLYYWWMLRMHSIQLALHNLRRICPPIANVLINT